MSAVKKTDPLGRLKAFGLDRPWQAPFLLPNGYQDLSKPYRLFRQIEVPDGEFVVVRGTLQSKEVRKDKGVPRLVGYVRDTTGASIGFVVFGETKTLQAQLDECAKDLYLCGTVSRLNNTIWLKEVEWVPPAWIGRIRPCYAGKTRVITPETARSRMMACLKEEGVEPAVNWLVDTLAMSEEEILRYSGTKANSLVRLLQKTHLPDSVEQGLRGQAGIERIAALGIARKAHREEVKLSGRRQFADLGAMLKTVPFCLTKEQHDAAAGMIAAFSRGVGQVMLSGDVGTGKTVVYGAVVAAALAAGMRVVCLLPNQALAMQIHQELTSYWPQFSCLFVTGDLPATVDVQSPSLLIGTSALLFRDLGHRDLVVVDEQQKFARQQREQLLSDNAMLIEATATCVPRTQALIHFGGVDVFRLRHCHVKKDIKTRIWSDTEKAELFQHTRDVLKGGGRVLVVYPKRQAGEGDDTDDFALPSAEDAFAQWSAAFPGRVRLAHGGQDDDANRDAILDMKAGKAQILIATSLVEVGITIPQLKQVIVVHAERFGLTTLHQIRGRVARDGGFGRCDLFLPRRVKEEAFNRLRVLVQTTDGFEVAREDMRQRGFGDLSAESVKQTGADDTFLFGRPLPVSVLESVMAQMESMGAAKH